MGKKNATLKTHIRGDCCGCFGAALPQTERAVMIQKLHKMRLFLPTLWNNRRQVHAAQALKVQPFLTSSHAKIQMSTVNVMRTRRGQMQFAACGAVPRLRIESMASKPIAWDTRQSCITARHVATPTTSNVLDSGSHVTECWVQESTALAMSTRPSHMLENGKKQAEGWYLSFASPWDALQSSTTTVTLCKNAGTI
jgi:hypothetical protein